MNDELESKVRIALRVAQMKRKIVPALLIEIHQRIDDLYEEYVGKNKQYKYGWPIFGNGNNNFYYDGTNGQHMKDYYRRHHEIVSFLEGVGVPDIKMEELSKLYKDLEESNKFIERDYSNFTFHDEQRRTMGKHFIYKYRWGDSNIYHAGCGHYKQEYGTNDLFGYPRAFEDLKATPWLHNQHPLFNTMNYKAKLFLICLEVGDLLDMEPTEPRALSP